MNAQSFRRLAALACAAAVLDAIPAFAMDLCGLITPPEAAALLGGQAGPTAAGPSGCVIAAAGASDGRLELTVATVAPEDAAKLLTHMDEARGDEIPSMHGDPWYEISAVDPARQRDRVVVIHRDRTLLTVRLHTAAPTDQQATVEAVWLNIAERLPVDD